MLTFSLAERFVSINGESRNAGFLAVFLRFSQCNLRCTYCDTAWANEETCPREDYSLEEILDYVKGTGARHITVTGGEPLLQDHVEVLLNALTEEGYTVEVETNGSVDLAPFIASCPETSFTMDYKMPSSAMEQKMYRGNLSVLRPSDTLKLVCGTLEDLNRGKKLMETEALHPELPIYLSPVFGELTGAEMVQYMIDEKITRWRMQLQMHKYIWPPEQRGV